MKLPEKPTDKPHYFIISRDCRDDTCWSYFTTKKEAKKFVADTFHDKDALILFSKKSKLVKG